MLKRIIILMAAAFMLLPGISSAQEEASIQLYQVASFASRLPEPLTEPYFTWIRDPAQVVCGISVQYSGDTAVADTPKGFPSLSSMVIADTPDGIRLLAAVQVGDQPWQVNDFTRLLRRSNNVSLSIYWPDSGSIPLFSVDYPDRTGMISDLMTFFGNQIWCMQGHVNKAQSVTIRNEMGMIGVRDAEGYELFRCSNPFFLEYMTDISVFPVNRADARAITWLPEYEPYSAGMTLYCEGANLRMEPTTKSESLGRYACNVPMVFTGEQQQGTNWPWYQVRIGNTLGWISGNYADDEIDLGLMPLLMGRTSTDCALYAAPGDSVPQTSLTPGTTFHILTEHQGMYHICIPQGEISWAVDEQGMYGYIPMDGILTGYSPSALDGMSNSR